MQIYQELIERLNQYSADYQCHGGITAEAADAIKTLLAELEAAVRDLTEVCEDNPDVCHLCKHLPCVDKNGNGRCIGWQWRGPMPPDRQQTES